MPQLHRRAAQVGAGLFAALLVVAGPAIAAGQRSFVSTSGVDNPTCSIASPCRTFIAAMSATDPGGEVIVLDSGGYGPFTITQSVSIIAPPGVYAGISVSAGTGVGIATAASDTVRISGLTINNIGSGNRGISQFAAGNLYVSDVVISGFVDGIVFNPTATSHLEVARTTVRASSSAGVSISASGASVVAHALLEDVVVSDGAGGVRIFDNAQAVVRRASIFANAQEGIGVYPQFFSSSTELLLESSNVSHNAGHGVSVGDPQGSSTVTIVGSTLTNNLDGVFTTNLAKVRLTGTTITRNTTGIDYLAGGIAESQGNNFIHGNTSDGTAPTIVGSK
jgi:hypothetical protein